MGKNKHARDKSKLNEVKIPYKFTMRLPVSLFYIGAFCSFFHGCCFIIALGEGKNTGDDMTVKMSYIFLVLFGISFGILLYYWFYRITFKGEEIICTSPFKCRRKFNVSDIGYVAFENRKVARIDPGAMYVYNKKGKRLFTIIMDMSNFVNFIMYLKKWNIDLK